MRLRLLTSPVWVTGLLAGLFFGGLTGLVRGLSEDDWTRALLVGVVSGAIFGLVMGPFVVRQGVLALGEQAQLPLDELQQVVRATARGPVPADPRLREEAVELLTRRQEQARRMRWPSVVLYAALALVFAGLALTRSPWYLLGVALWLALLGWTWGLLGRQQRRLELLSRAGD